MTGPGTLGCSYLLLDPAVGEVVTAGPAERDRRRRVQVTIPADVTGALFPGFYELYLAADSDSLARSHRASRGPRGPAVPQR